MGIVIESPRDEKWAIVIGFLGRVLSHRALDEFDKSHELVLLNQVLGDFLVVAVDVGSAVQIRDGCSRANNTSAKLLAE